MRRSNRSLGQPSGCKFCGVNARVDIVLEAGLLVMSPTEIGATITERGTVAQYV